MMAEKNGWGIGASIPSSINAASIQRAVLWTVVFVLCTGMAGGYVILMAGSGDPAYVTKTAVLLAFNVALVAASAAVPSYMVRGRD